MTLTHDFGWGSAHRWTPDDMYSNGELIGALMARKNLLEITDGCGHNSVLGIQQGRGKLLLHPGEWLVEDGHTVLGRPGALHVFANDRFTVLVGAARLREKTDSNFDAWPASSPMSHEATVHLADTLRMCAWTWDSIPEHVRSAMKAIANETMRFDRPDFLESVLVEEMT